MCIWASGPEVQLPASHAFQARPCLPLCSQRCQALLSQHPALLGCTLATLPASGCSGSTACRPGMAPTCLCSRKENSRCQVVHKPTGGSSAASQAIPSHWVAEGPPGKRDGACSGLGSQQGGRKCSSLSSYSFIHSLAHQSQTSPDTPRSVEEVASRLVTFSEEVKPEDHSHLLLSHSPSLPACCRQETVLRVLEPRPCTPSFWRGDLAGQIGLVGNVGTGRTLTQMYPAQGPLLFRDGGSDQDRSQGKG